MKVINNYGLAFVLVMLCVFLCTSEAWAVRITNETTGTLLFDSLGFENDTVGDGAVAANPGHWDNWGPPVEEVITGGSPGAFEGVNYLRTYRDFVGSGNPRAFFDEQSTLGDHIHAEWMMWVPAVADIGFFLDVGYGPGTYGAPVLQTRIGSGGQYVSYYDGAFHPMDPQLDYIPEQWQKWELDYNVGASEFTVTIDDTSSSTAPIFNPFKLSVNHLSFFHNGFQTYFLDSVPSVSLEGDLNGDGFVGIADLNIVLGAWNQNVPPGDPLADPSGDGFVGIADLNVVLGNWNAGTPPAGSVIPEPSALALVTLGGLSLIRRSRGRKV